MKTYISVDNTICVVFSAGKLFSIFLFPECDTVSFDALKHSFPFYEDDLNLDLFQPLKR